MGHVVGLGVLRDGNRGEIAPGAGVVPNALEMNRSLVSKTEHDISLSLTSH